MIRIAAIDLGARELARAVLELGRRAYRLEAERIGFDGIPMLSETLDELVGCGETFLGAWVEGALAGFVSWKREGDTIDLHRLAVDAGFARRGVGSALLRAALAREPGARRAVVGTGSANEPAVRLYEREGFAREREREIAPGIRVTLFARDLGYGPAR